MERIESAVKDWNVEVQLVNQMDPVYMEKDGPIITALLSAYHQITGDGTDAQIMGGGTYARAMKNIVAFGPVFPWSECTEHQKDEYAAIEDLEKAREIYRVALKQLLQIGV